MTLSHERLDAYQVAIQFLAFSTELVRTFPKGHSALADQLRRAALSVPLNTAEAVGKTTKNDSARYFAIARGSALECAAIIDACEILSLLDPARKAQGKALLGRVVSMLSKLCR
jgi:four helix bundle protein